MIFSCCSSAFAETEIQQKPSSKEVQEKYLSLLESSSFRPSKEEKLLDFEHPFYDHLRSQIVVIINELEKLYPEHSRDFSELPIYVYLSAKKYRQNANIIKLNENVYRIVFKLHVDNLREDMYPTLAFIMGHELVHKLEWRTMRYYINESKTDIIEPNDADEFFAENMNLWNALRLVGYVRQYKSSSFPLEASVLNRHLEFLKYFFLDSDEYHEFNASKTVKESRELYYSNFSVVNDRPDFSKVSVDQRDSGKQKLYQLFKKNPVLSRVKLYHLENALNYPENYFFTDWYLGKVYPNLGSKEIAQKSLLDVIFDTADYWTNYIEKHSDELESYLPKLRVLSIETTADEVSAKLLKRIGIHPEDYMAGFLNLLRRSNESNTENCLELIYKNIEPVFDFNLSSEHPNSCWRMYRVYKIIDDQRQKQPVL